VHSMETPIIFQDWAVRSILDREKTQTRRLCKEQPNAGDGWQMYGEKSPYGQVGDFLWVREAWAAPRWLDDEKPRNINSRIAPCPYYRARDMWRPLPQEKLPPHLLRGKWRASIHMPRWVSRIDLRITDLWIDRVQNITPEDAIAEGMDPDNNSIGLRYSFGQLWNQMYESRGLGWETNPYVWVIEFERVTP